MPRDTRAPRQPGTPGRSSVRARRAVARPESAAKASLVERPGQITRAPAVKAETPRRPPTSWTPPALPFILANRARTARTLVLVGVLAVFALVCANSLRVLMAQQRDLRALDTQISAQQAQIADLRGQLQRWNDPAYVKSQAQSQLGWVAKGEAGYRVIGKDGVVLAEPGTTSGIAVSSSQDQTRWWDRLAGSVQSADAPPVR